MIFDRMQDKRDETAKSDSTMDSLSGGTFRVMFGVEECTVTVAPEQTVKGVFRNKAEALGLDYDRRLSFRDNQGNLLTGDERPVAGRDYLAAITHDAKG